MVEIFTKEAFTTDWKEGDPIIVNDGQEGWVLYKDDNAYRFALQVAPDEAGIRHVAREITEGLQTWWYNEATKKSDALIDELAIPWGELAITDLDIQDGNLMAISEKLARASFYIVQVNNKLTRLMALQAAAKEALDHATNRLLARGDEEGKKGTVAARTAAAISRDKRLRNAKIELIEATAQIKSLEILKDSLETLWKTISRVLSARMREPIE